MSRFLGCASALALILSVFVVMSSTVVAEGGPPTIWTDKEDYFPEETVIIYGENFTAYDFIEVKITRPDGAVEYANTYADEYGSFTTEYLLNGITGEYLVEATDEHGLYAFTTFTDGKPPELFGWDWKFDDWTKSTLEGYGAGDWVWWHVKIYDADPGTYKMVWNHDYYNKLLGTYGFIEIKDVRLLYEDYPNENETGITVTVEGPFYPEESNTILIEYNATFTIETAGDYYLRWDARIDENETKPWPGKALHTHFKEWYLDGDYKNAGNQDVQVEQPLSPPLSIINGYKWHDMDEDGIWDDGEPALENWTMHLTGEDIHGKIVNRYRFTDNNGYYQFAGVIEGNYTVSEELQTGWKCTNRSGDPPSTGTISITEEDTNVTHIDFGNAHLTPDIQVTKTGDVTGAYWGDTVTYAVVVTNIGEATLYDVYVYDDLLDVYYYKENVTGSDELAPDESWTLTYTYTVQSGDDDPLVNTVTAYGTDSFGTEVMDEDSWSVDILHYAGTLTVVKTGPATAYHGDSVTYTIEVTYSSPDNSPAQNVVVVDDHYGTATYISGDTDGDGLLDVTETWTYEVSGTIDAHDDAEEDPIVNTATATGEDLDGDAVTPGSDDHSTDILHEAGTLTVIKTGPIYVHHGYPVTYTIEVTYSSPDNSPAQNVAVVDDVYGPASYVSGDADGDGLLDVTETWTYEVSDTIDAHDDS
ncbi:MAG: DUF11 domain-containing protein, partial [Thermoplasmata archaeon]